MLEKVARFIPSPLSTLGSLALSFFLLIDGMAPPKESPAAAKKPRLPRVFVIRHGETEWSLSGQHASSLLGCPPGYSLTRTDTLAPLQTGLTDIPLTSHGESIVRQLGTRIVGQGKILDPAHIQHVFVSPRQRAQKTYDLLFQDVDKKPSCSVEEDVREWEYGVCEGARSSSSLGDGFASPGQTQTTRAHLTDRRETRDAQARRPRRSGPRLATTGTSGPWVAPRGNRPTRSETAATASSKRLSTWQSEPFFSFVPPSFHSCPLLSFPESFLRELRLFSFQLDSSRPERFALFFPPQKGPEGYTYTQDKQEAEPCHESSPSRSAHHGKEDTEGHHGDIVVVSHGHFSRCFMYVPSLPAR